MPCEIERDFEYCGLRCVVVATPMGHRCGYVEVPSGSGSFGVGYDGMPDGWDVVHGGLTYAGDRFGDGSWYAGFDCAHGFDGRDPELCEDIPPDVYPEFFFQGHAWTADEVAEECKLLAVAISADCGEDRRKEGRYGLLESIVANGAALLPENRREDDTDG